MEVERKPRRLLGALALLGAGILGLVGAAVMLFTAGGPATPGPWRIGGALGWLLLAGFALMRLEAPWRFLVPILGAVAIVFAWSRVPPRSDLDWESDHARAPGVSHDDGRATIDGFRRFRHRKDKPTVERWTQQTFQLDQLDGCDFIVVPFQEDPRLAHTMVTFRFREGPAMCVSIEARRQRGEAYSVWRALFRQFELIHVVGDEEDLIGLRAAVRGDEVYIYPIDAEPAAIRRFLDDILARIDQVQRAPEWYDTLRSNCTTGLVDSYERVSGRDVGFDLRILMPGGSPELVRELGLIAEDHGDAESSKAAARVDKRARHVAEGADYSRFIRGN